MVVESTDIKFHFCDGGGPGEDRLGNKGGSIHSLGIIEHGVRYNWVPDIPRSVLGLEGDSGTWDWYIPCHVRNHHNSETVTNIKTWCYKLPNNPRVNIQMAREPAGENDPMRVIQNHSDDPDDAVWVNAVNEATSVQLVGNMNPNNSIGVWVRLYGSKGVRSMKDCQFGIKVKFTRLAA